MKFSQIQNTRTIPIRKVATMADKYEKENLAEKYLEGRPRSYPANWYSKLAALTAGHSLACDFGTGNGQAALGVSLFILSIDLITQLL